MTRNPMPKSAAMAETRQSGDPDRVGVPPRPWRPSCRRAMATRSRCSARTRSRPRRWEIRAMLPDAEAVILSARRRDGARAMERGARGRASSSARSSADDRPLYRLRIERARRVRAALTIPTAFGAVLSEDDLRQIRRCRQRRAVYRTLGAHPLDRRRHSGLPLHGLGAQCPPRERRRRLQQLGRPRATPCACATSAASGSFSFPISRRASATSSRSRARRQPARPEGRPRRLRGGAAARDRLGRCTASPELRLAATRNGSPARDGAGSAQGADVDLRDAISARGRGCPRKATAISPIANWPTGSIPYVKDLGFTHIELLPITEYPVRRVLGLSAGLAISRRPAGSARPEDFAAFVEAAHEAGIGAHPRLGARPLPERPAWPWLFRRHASLRARRSAPGLPPRLGHLHLQLRPPGGRRTSWSRMPSSGSSAITSTACGSMPSPRCSTSTTRARPASGSPTATAATRTSRRSTSCAA